MKDEERKQEAPTVEEIRDAVERSESKRKIDRDRDAHFSHPPLFVPIEKKKQESEG